MAGEGAPNCAQIQKKKSLAERDGGGLWKTRIHNSPAPPARARGPAALATVPSGARVLCARASGRPSGPVSGQPMPGVS